LHFAETHSFDQRAIRSRFAVIHRRSARLRAKKISSISHFSAEFFGDAAQSVRPGQQKSGSTARNAGDTF